MGVALEETGLVCVDIHHVSNSITKHLHGSVIARAHQHRVVRREGLASALVLDVVNGICSWCPTTHINDGHAFKIAKAIDFGLAVYQHGQQACSFVHIENSGGEIDKLVADSSCVREARASIKASVLKFCSQFWAVLPILVPAIFPERLDHLDLQILAKSCHTICDVLAQALQVAILIDKGEWRIVDILSELDLRDL
eukprot:CAMPEP_0197637088 /NCGR_PEP_ID=MMETSP1338-20131121/12420_1 /TAXON_ID=43686 ORGANISM="Pelagodinium beii, Strain RCC1491" /NCGR_SAMPLE_ID=MMETSP1338 /ASSEMBLY_ACC=CAM_ASM_000754 /LENGTH=196 /DNA_ID=CAMNT_0043209459 /DNA_START=113 /DNA_END=703 /DNA_ORIENTATION=+